MTSNRKKVLAYGLLTVLIWASAFPLTKIAQEQFSSYSLGFLRCGIATVFLLLIGKIRHIRLPEKKDVPLFILSGALGFGIYLIAFNTGIQTLTSATSSIVIAVTPILTAIAAARMYNERLSPIGWAAIFSAFAGVLLLLLWDGIFSINVGLLWTLGAAVSFCGYNLINRELSSLGYNALEIVTYSMLCGALLLSFWSVQGVNELFAANHKQIAAIVYLGAFPSAAAYFFWGEAMSYAERISEVTNFNFVTPLLSAVMGFLLLKEIPNAGTFIGGAAIIASIVVFNKKGKAS